MNGEVQALVFDNVRPSSLGLDDLLSGRVAVWLSGAAADVPPVVLAVPMAEWQDGPEAA